MNLTGTIFRAISNSKHGSINTETEMRFTSDEQIVIGSYGGGNVTTGHVIGKRIGDAEIEMLYHSANVAGDIQAGKAHGRFAMDEEGRMHLYLDWQWLTGDGSVGQSEWLLIAGESDD
jgi:outer membrane lipoprotein SlyB